MEKVLVIPRIVVDKAFGVSKEADNPTFAQIPNVQVDVSTILGTAEVPELAGIANPIVDVEAEPLCGKFVDREPAETDTSILQLIPYTVFMVRDAKNMRVFSYYRSKKSGESRLQGRMSIGVGGHINPCDKEGQNPYLQALEREITEELGVDLSKIKLSKFCDPYRVWGVIRDTRTEVSKVHVGILHIFDMTEEPQFNCEDTKIGVGFRTLEEIMVCDMEDWTKLVLEYLMTLSANPNAALSAL
jgi:predicted NUDIX family phosphoesterase